VGHPVQSPRPRLALGWALFAAGHGTPGLKRARRSQAANSTRAPRLDPVSPKSRKTITKLKRTKWPPQPWKLLSELSQLLVGNCSGRNRYIAGFKIGQRGSLYFFYGPHSTRGYCCGTAAAAFRTSLFFFLIFSVPPPLLSQSLFLNNGQNHVKEPLRGATIIVKG